MDSASFTVDLVNKETYQLIRALRKAHNLTQEKVAELSGLRRVEISNLENASGRNQAKTDRIRGGLARAFGLTRDDLALYLEGQITLETLMHRKDRKQTVELEISPEDEELFRAIHFLRGQLPDEFLNEVVKIKSYGGNRFSRDQLLLMIRERYIQWKDAPKGPSDADLITEEIERERSK